MTSQKPKYPRYDTSMQIVLILFRIFYKFLGDIFKNILRKHFLKYILRIIFLIFYL